MYSSSAFFNKADIDIFITGSNAHNFKLDESSIYPYIAAIFDTVVLKDVIAKNEIRNVQLLEKIIDFVLENIGSPFSAKSMADYLKSQRLSVGMETIQNYLSYLEAAYIIEKLSRLKRSRS